MGEPLSGEHIRQFFEDAALREQNYGRAEYAAHLRYIAESVSEVPDELLSGYLELMADDEVGDRMVEMQLPCVPRVTWRRQGRPRRFLLRYWQGAAA